MVVINCKFTVLIVKFVESCPELKFQDGHEIACDNQLDIANRVEGAILDPNIKSLELISTPKTSQLIYSMINFKRSNVTVIYRDLNLSVLTFQPATGSKPVNKFTLFCSDLIIRLVSFLKWNQFTFIYDSDSDIQPHEFGLLLKPTNLPVTAINMDFQENIVKELFNHLDGAFINFVVNCRHENLQSVLALAKNAETNVFSPTHHWVFIDGAADGSHTVENSLGNHSGLSWRFWILHVDKLQLDLSSAVNVFMCTNNVCNISQSCVDISENVLNTNMEYSTALDRVELFENCQLIGLIASFPDIIHWSNGHGMEAYNYTGIDWEIVTAIIESLQKVYNGLQISFEITKDIDLKPRSWSHLMTTLYRQKTGLDMVLPFGHISPDVTYNHLDFSVSTYEVVYGIVGQRSLASEAHGDYLKPMTGDFGNLVFIVLTLAGVTLAITYYLSPYSHFRRNVGEDETQLELSFSHTMFATWYLFLVQAHDGFPNYTSGRIVYVIVLMAGFMFVQYYSAVLMSALTVRHLRISFHGAADLVVNQEYRVGADNLYDIVGILSQSHDPVLKNLSNRIMSDPDRNLFYRPEDAIYPILHEKFAYLTPINRMEPILRANCKLAIVIPEVVRVTKHLIFKRNFPFKHLFSQRIEQMKISGSMQHIYSKHFPNIPNPCDSTEAKLRQVSYETIRPVMVLLALMVTTAHLVFIWEMCLESLAEKFRPMRARPVSNMYSNAQRY